MNTTDVNRRGSNGSTVLMGATTGADVDAVARLVAAGADVNLRDDDGQTALMRAAGVRFVRDEWDEERQDWDDGTKAKQENMRRYDCMKTLIQAGADVNAQDNDGQTALMMAGGWGDLEMIKTLIASGANVDLQDNDGQTAEDALRAGGAGEENTKVCLEQIQAAQSAQRASQRASELDAKLDQACDSWSPPSASSKQATRGHQSISDKQGQAQQETLAPRSRQRF